MNTARTYGKRKRQCAPSTNSSAVEAKRPRESSFFYLLTGTHEEAKSQPPTDVLSAMACIFSLALWAKLEASSIPPVVLRHQLYTFLSDRSQVDREVGQLLSEHVLVQVQIDRDTYGLINVKDFVRTAGQSMQKCDVASGIREKFISAIEMGRVEVSMRRDRLQQLCSLSDADISTLVRCGLLAIRDAHTVWLSIPNAYVLTRALTDGRQVIVDAIRRTKFKEVLLSELLKKPLAKGISTGIRYCLLDLIGSETLTFVDTTSGPMLRAAG